jgi:hypothetical protein
VSNSCNVVSRNFEKELMTNRANKPPDARREGHKRIFAAVSRPVTVGDKAVRHVVIFDTHPATLCLLREVDPFNLHGTRICRTPQGTLSWHIILGMILVALVATGMFWPLLGP